ncbi:MAG: hypothetical protein IH987_00235 [Planctomycetes bacterium]|nr:hypothetical protein [Planctomycetota bacterium]
MTKSKTDVSDQNADPNARVVITPEDKAKAGQWFRRARELGEKRQFEYAIEYYVNGLEFWPNAVEEACKPLHGCAVARRQFGGKKPGLKDTMKRSMNDKDPKRALLNAAWLFGHDPDNADYADGMAKAASRLRAEEVAVWAACVCKKALDGARKVNAKQLQNLTKLYEALGDRYAARNEVTEAVATYQFGVDVLNAWSRRVPKDRNIDNAVRDLSTKLTIVRGKYQDSASYRDSIVDQEEQKDLHDIRESKQADDRVESLIEKAEAAYRGDPKSPGNLNQLIDLLTRREIPDDETQAIDLLVSKFEETENYRHKHQADDIRMKQLKRSVREARQTGDQESLKQAHLASLRFDLSVFKDRAVRYPTDNRVKYELGVRLFNAGRFDDAIPVFQAARSDLKNRAGCGMYLGRCFYRKGYHPQAIAALETALADYEFSDDDTAKAMLYWLGRSQEATGGLDAARESYGKILQMDYNYKDVRAKLDGLPSSD